MAPRLCDRIFDTFVLSEFDKQTRRFSPEGSLDDVITSDSINRAFPAIEPTLVAFILKEAKKVFAIAVSIRFRNKEILQVMKLFMSKRISDSNLPFDEELWDTHALRSSALEEEPGHVSDDDDKELWSSSMIANFCEEQWRFCATVFSTDESFYDLNSSAILPFTDKENISDNGAFGRVSRFEIHEAHLDTKNLVS